MASDAAYGEVFGAEHLFELFMVADETVARVDFGRVTANVAVTTRLGGAVDDHTNAIGIFGMATAGAMAFLAMNTGKSPCAADSLQAVLVSNRIKARRMA